MDIMENEINHLRIRYYYEDAAEDYYLEKQAHRKKKGTDNSKELQRLTRELTLLFRGTKRSSSKKDEKKETQSYFHSGYYPLNNSKINKRETTTQKKIPEIRKQNCIVKGNWSFNKNKHKNFLRTYMPQKNKDQVKEKPVLFSETENEVSEETLLDYEKNIMAQKFYRFIISPEKNEIPVESMVRSLMKKVEAATGYKLYWFGAKHTDTDHHHAHILINGIDKNGRTVSFGNGFFKKTFRSLARDCCTSYLGLRTDEEIKAEKLRMPFLKRYTKLDKEIEKYEVEGYGNNDFNSVVIVQNELMQQRLSTLEMLELAKKSDDGKKYYLEKNWKDKLKAMGAFNSFIEARNSLRYVDQKNLVQYKKNIGSVKGIVTRIFKSNYEDSWTNAILVENKSENKAWYIPFKEEPSDKLFNATVEFGMTQTFLSSGKQSLKRNLRVLDWGIQSK